MKDFWKEKWVAVLIVIFLLMVFFLLDVKLWQWLENKFNSEDVDRLKVIQWTIFQGPSNKLYTEYWKFLDWTDEYLKLETYDLTNKFFKASFQNLSNRWIPVQIILENNKYQEYQNTFNQLQDYFSWDENVELRSDEQMWTTYVHAKVILNEDSFWIQTANFTKSSFESNREYFFHGEDEEFRDSLEKLIDADWVWDDLFTLDIHPNLVVCPLNCRDVIENLLKNAKESVIIQTQYIVDDEILDVLSKKSNEVEVKIIVADSDDNYDLVSLFWPWVVRTLRSHYNHTKMILIDEKYLLLGSMNLSSNSLNKNREIWIILMDPWHISEFEKRFNQDWAESV